jgi:ABC-type glutathione transport system ATPase component
MMRLQAEMGLAFLFISHDIAVVERISHRTVVMCLGEIVEIGPRASAEPIRAVDYRHAPRQFRQVVQGHLVQEIAG